MDPGRAGRADELVGGSPDEAPRRRRGLWAAGLLAVAAAVVVARPDLAFVGLLADPASSRPAPPAATAPGPVTGAARSAPLDGIRWAPRGDLVEDDRFVAAAVARIASERPEATRLFFAGRLPDGARLVLAGTDVNRGIVATRVHALQVPPGGATAAGTVTEAAALTDPQQILAWAARGRDGSVSVVALTRPGPVMLEVSAGVRFGADGAPARVWTPAYAPDGLLVADLGRDVDPVVAVRADGPGVFSLPLVVRVVPRVPARPGLLVVGTGGPAYRGPEAEHLSRALRAGAGLVADLDKARIEVLWSGAPYKSRRLALLLVTRADGRRLQALVGQQGEQGFPAGVRALPQGAVSQVPWLLEPFSPDDPTLLLCPSGPGSLVYRREGRADKVLPVGADGVVALVEPGPSPPSVSGAEVILRDPDGGYLLRTTLPGPGFDDALALD